jgi:hypothetical protein
MLIEYTVRIGGGASITQSVDLGSPGATRPPKPSAPGVQPSAISPTGESIPNADVGSHHDGGKHGDRPPDPVRGGAAARPGKGAGDPPPTTSGGGTPGSGTIIVFGPVIFLASAPGGGEPPPTTSGGESRDNSAGSSSSSSATTLEKK